MIKIPVGSEAERLRDDLKQQQTTDRIQNKLYFRYKMKLERQRVKQNKEVAEFLRKELDRVLEPIKKEEKLRVEKEAMEQSLRQKLDPNSLLARDNISFK